MATDTVKRYTLDLSESDLQIICSCLSMEMQRLSHRMRDEQYNIDKTNFNATEQGRLNVRDVYARVSNFRFTQS